MTRRFRLTIFVSLYFAQGMLMSYFLTFNILYLGEFGYTAGEVGIFQAVLAIPFVLKIFLGMFSDGVNLFGLGHRKPYIALGLLGQIIAMLIAPNLSVTENISLFVINALVASISMALYDTCTDGYALDITPDNERGLIQGAMVGARAAGILLMLVVGGLIVDKLGWTWVFYAISIFTLAPLGLILRTGLREGSQDLGKREPFQWKAFRNFGSKEVILLVVVGFIYTISLDGVLTFLSDYLRSAYNTSVGNIGLLVALSMVGRIIGALSNSRVTDKVGNKQSLIFAIALGSIGCFGLAFNPGVLWIGFFAFLFGLAYGYYNAVYSAVAMSVCHPGIAASMFAIFMMFVNLGTVGGQSIGGLLTENLGFATMVTVFGLLNLVNIPVVYLLFRKKRA